MRKENLQGAWRADLFTDLTHPFCKKLQKGVGILDRTSVLLKNGTILFYFYLFQKWLG
ncbi:MAG: hypothetical protein ACI9XO_003016, partial [Paraglaciecola sp.]